MTSHAASSLVFGSPIENQLRPSKEISGMYFFIANSFFSLVSRFVCALFGTVKGFPVG
jgi:hypothetical protein